MNILMQIFLVIASLGNNVTSYVGLSRSEALLYEKSEKITDKYPWMSVIRAKLQKISKYERDEAVKFLEQHLSVLVSKKLHQFEAFEYFDAIVLNDKSIRSLVESIAKHGYSHNQQRVILLILLSVALPARVAAESFDAGLYIEKFEQEGIMIISHNDSWAVKLKSGAVWPANIVEKFIK